MRYGIGVLLLAMGEQRCRHFEAERLLSPPLPQQQL